VASRDWMRRARPTALAAPVRWLVPLVLLPLAALAAAAVEAPGSTLPAPSPRIRTIYERDCAVCHGNDARGSARGPSLVGVGAGALDFWLSTGRMPIPSPSSEPQRRAPAYGPATIRSLVGYVQSLTGPGGPVIPHVDLRTADLANGGTLFRVQCAACHSWAGEGGALVSRAAPPTNRATPTQIAEALRTGPGAMPRFGSAALSDQEVADVVAYVRYLDHPNDHGGYPLGRIGPLAEGAVAVFVALGLLFLAIRWIGTRA
jgi:quinol---cytochrome-c reductase cytochrome c subunit